MKADAEKLLEEALKLPAESRAEMAGRLLRSLEDDEEPSPEQYDQAWGDEIARRIREVEDGSVRPLQWEAARRRIASDDDPADD